MDNDINIIPILTEYDENKVNKISKDSFYELEEFNGASFLKLAFALAINGSTNEDYNIYIIINSYDEDNGRYNIFGGGFKLLKNKDYDKLIFKRTFIKFLEGTKRNMDLTIYKLPVSLDRDNPNLLEGEFSPISDINFDLDLVLSKGIFTSATTFKVEA